MALMILRRLIYIKLRHWHSNLVPSRMSLLLKN